MDTLAKSIILTHNPSGFDERALLRVQLIDLAKGFGPVRQMLDVLHTIHRDSNEHKELMEEAEQAGVRRHEATLGQAFKVHADCCSNFSENLLTCFCQVSAYLLRDAAVCKHAFCKHAHCWAELAHLAWRELMVAHCFAGVL